MRVVVVALLALAAPAPAFAAGELVSRESGVDGAPAADGESNTIAVANGGRLVLFNSRADNLSREDHDVADNDDQSTAYLRDMRTGRLTLVARTRAGEAADGAVSALDMTPDARFVVFSTWAPNHGGPGLFVRDMRRRTTRLVARGDGGAAISDDGRAVAFRVGPELRVLARGRVRVVRRPPADRVLESFAISGDGRYVSFSEGPGERPGVVEVFRAPVRRPSRAVVVQRQEYAEDPQLTAVPLSFTGRFLGAMRPVPRPDLPRADYFDVARWDVPRSRSRTANRDGCRAPREVLASSGLSMSGDGRRVAWIGPPGEGASPEFPWLVHVADVPRCRVLRLEAAGGALPEDDSFAAVLSADGRWVGFSSWADNLSTEDDDDVVNAYVARVPG